jgi:hypothetical protein
VRFALRVFGVLLAATTFFMTLSMIEEWPVFRQLFARAPPPSPQPDRSAIERRMREFNTAMARDERAAPEESMAAAALREDQQFRVRRGIRQELTLEELTLGEVRPAGPRRIVATTRERSRLVISRPGGVPRAYAVKGTWRYTLAMRGEALEVVDVLPEETDLEPLDDGKVQ